jgi:hypothetical protein
MEGAVCGDGMCPWVPCEENKKKGTCEHERRFIAECEENNRKGAG